MQPAIEKNSDQVYFGGTKQAQNCLHLKFLILHHEQTRLQPNLLELKLTSFRNVQIKVDMSGLQCKLNIVSLMKVSVLEIKKLKKVDHLQIWIRASTLNQPRNPTQSQDTIQYYTRVTVTIPEWKHQTETQRD